MKELEKTYDPGAIEEKTYQKWLDNGYFKADPKSVKPGFCIPMPPPNVTGQLHMGHALDNTLQDTLCRYKRMKGFEVLWQPGTDHAAIATEVKVTNKLKEQGIDKRKIGREAFLKEAWKWKDEYEGRILHQMHKMGVSADWSRLRFTMDEGCSKAVQKVFIDLYNRGLIYKGNRIINWCPKCQTSLSDAEVIHEDQQGAFWHINYPVKGEPGRFVEIATTRPETLLGDTAVAVNPADERYKDIVGKELLLPLTDRTIPVIADEYVDIDFGTGCVKITPAHDPNDFEVGKRHNLEEICILHDDATIDCPGSKYDGMDRYEARKVMVEDLLAQGLLVKVVPYSHAVGTHDRCGTTVEPMIKAQWFVKMQKASKDCRDILENGTLGFVPDNYSKTYLHWVDNLKDWCISRQIWWGHRIPAYTCEKCGKMVVSAEAPCTCPDCGGSMLQDEDTLDTWFSSALWPFSTLGWPEETDALKKFYPASVLVTGYDIIFFWVIRMCFSGVEHMGRSPFDKVLIHGLVRDALGRKMSKSLGNGIDPIEIIDKYGADALRGALLTGNAPGNDMRFTTDKVEASRNFANKIWNASRFIMMNLDRAGELKEGIDVSELNLEDRWILAKFNDLCANASRNMDAFELGIALDNITDFVWNELCDWYIEMVKQRLYDDADTTKAAALRTLKYVLCGSLKLLHPFMPFVTEEIYTNLTGEDTIMTAAYPGYTEEFNFAKEMADVESIKEAVRAIRNVRTEMNVPPSKKALVYVIAKNESAKESFTHTKNVFARLCGASSVDIRDSKEGIEDSAVSAVTKDVQMYMPLGDLIDIEKEIERLNKEKARLEGELKRSRGMLSNEKFISKAPAAKIEEERAKLAGYEDMMAKVTERLSALR